MRRLPALLAVSLAACALEPFPNPVAVPACAEDADCDDHTACTVDTCSAGACVYDYALQGTSCGAADACTGAQTCDGQGSCVASTPIATDDGDPCTADACDPASGVVTHTPIPRCWAPMSTQGAPSPRRDHTAVWTGARMIVWGGSVDGMPSVTATGASYDPGSGTWSPIAAAGAPPARKSHVAAWTGSRMVVWGGFGVTDYEPGGGVYDPAKDTWSAMSTTGAPSPRASGAAVWTGSSLVVWGGAHSGAALGDGASYDPATDTWTALPSAGAPTPRFNHTGVWASDRVVFWGGYDAVDWMATGAAYDPVAGAWAGATPSAGAPEARGRHSAVWTGARMVIWGGDDPNQFIASGGSLDLAGAAWQPLASIAAPSARGDHTALWTGVGMLVWGGCGGSVCDPLGDGGLWAPDATGGTWAPIPVSPVIDGRYGHTAVWTGSKALVWGGETAAGRTATGGVLSP